MTVIGRSIVLHGPGKIEDQGRLRWMAGEARTALHTEFFPSLLPSKGHFPAFQTVCFKKMFSAGKPPDPHITVESLGD